MKWEEVEGKGGRRTELVVKVVGQHSASGGVW
jgi:hypothetical protein